MNKLILVFVLVLFGCANNQYIENAKREAAYRRTIDDTQNTTIPTAGQGPIEMPQEWIDQWRDKPIDKNQK
jgi:PBP1b-binding outer membrane lipoprotein LpoB